MTASGGGEADDSKEEERGDGRDKFHYSSI